MNSARISSAPPADSVDAAEDRERFDELLEKCEIPRPQGHTVFTAEEAIKAANELGYPGSDAPVLCPRRPEHDYRPLGQGH